MSERNIAIRVNHLGKQYRLGGPQEQYLTFRDAIVNTLKAPLKKFQPAKPDEGFWALKDVSFEVEQGDVVGIIGRNGAGKSTLLKILSRITTPTEGTVELHGRVGSLLEVGTGFHPEMTGRENIFLNGSILGMKKSEIDEKFDEIVKFSEIEKFLDTPVKRYSSGMYVRLAFAVAAHLEPEILLVDEVLAVGDAQFQKKCLGKMGQVAKEGRTVLFVSHSMPMISSLCNRCILLNNGEIQIEGVTGEVIASYLISDTGTPAFVDYTMSPSPPGDNLATLLSAWIEDYSGKKVFEIEINKPFRICMHYRVLKDVPKIPYPNFHFYDTLGQCVFITSPIIDYNYSFNAGEYIAKCEVPSNFFNDGLFSVDLALTFSHSGIHVSFWEKHALSFNIIDPLDGIPTRATGYTGRIPGVVRPLLNWNMENLS